MEQHRWILTVIDDLDAYFEKNNLDGLRDRITEMRRDFFIEVQLQAQADQEAARALGGHFPTSDLFELDLRTDMGRLH